MAYKYLDEAHTMILADDGRTIPVDPRNADYRELVVSGATIAPYTPNYAARVADAKAAVVEFATGCAGTITGPVPEAEKMGWLKKEAAARAYLAGTADTAQTNLLSIEAGMTGESVSALASTIIAKADKYSAAVALISGHRRATMAAIDALGATPTQPQIDAVLTAAKAQAQAALAALLAS